MWRSFRHALTYSQDMDEDALNVLIAEGLDVPTAYAASVEDAEPARHDDAPNDTARLGAIIGLGIAMICWLVWLFV